jgi:uncharacterized SAM-binding protein YcdF (DUF218 family)
MTDYGMAMPDQTTNELGLPEGRKKAEKTASISIWRWILFIFIALYFVLSAYRVPILNKLGGYLIVEHKPEKADLIVCLGGEDPVKTLGAIDVYSKGFAPYIFRGKEEDPDGLDYLRETIKDYPSSFDLFMRTIRGFGVPDEAILSSDERVGSTIDEARLARKIVLERGFKSLILVTSLTHSRRSWLTFKKIFEGDDIRIISIPSHYQLFDPKDWWKKRRYVKAIIVEYQKLIYYKIAYLV